MNSWPWLWRQPARSDHSRPKAGCQGGEVGYGGWLWWHHTHEESLASVTPTASRSEDVTWPQNCLSLADVHWSDILKCSLKSQAITVSSPYPQWPQPVSRPLSTPPRPRWPWPACWSPPWPHCPPRQGRGPRCLSWPPPQGPGPPSPGHTHGPAPHPG